MNVSKDEITKVAKLASLNLSEEEIEKMTSEMEGIIGFANTVGSINTDNIEISNRASELINVFRKDEVKEFTDTESLLANCEEIEDNMFKIPKVL
jgi:aspartyl/glutamyl-tRNA(Asn/Gln) amidotransferase, C subunit